VRRIKVPRRHGSTSDPAVAGNPANVPSRLSRTDAGAPLLEKASPAREVACAVRG